MKIYYGRNRLENWLIDLQGITTYSSPGVSYGSIKTRATKQRTKQTVENTSQSVVETISQPDFNTRRVVGANMVRAGVTILMVPDPIPLVDEIIAFGLIGVGTYLVYTS
jgi:hypothetical protein